GDRLEAEEPAQVARLCQLPAGLGADAGDPQELDGRGGEQRGGVAAGELPGLHVRPADEAAPEAAGPHDAPQRRPLPPPGVAVTVEQLHLASGQVRLARVVRRQPGALDLDADELGPGRVLVVAVLVEPVGIDQAGGVVLRGLGDGLAEGVALGHGPALPPFRALRSPKTLSQPRPDGFAATGLLLTARAEVRRGGIAALPARMLQSRRWLPWSVEHTPMPFLSPPDTATVERIVQR